MVNRIENIVRMSNHLQNNNYQQQQQLRQQLKRMEQENKEDISKAMSKICIDV